jgi:DNA-binding response OmpR family regulator
MNEVGGRERDARSVLIVDDEPPLIRLVTAILQVEGLHSIGAKSGQEGLRLAATVNPDLVLLDQLLPDGPGLDMIGEFRRRTSAPILVITASDRLLPRSLPLADDFMAKPFDPDELVTRTKCLLNMPDNAGPPVAIRHGPLMIDLERRSVSIGEGSVPLAQTEWLLLEELTKTEQGVRFDKELLVRLWGPANGRENALLSAYVARLCKKLSASDPPLIERVAEIGYRLAGTARISYSE